jgi:hypothetical protein
MKIQTVRIKSINRSQKCQMKITYYNFFLNIFAKLFELNEQRIG